jgi:hypothetical protein
MMKRLVMAFALATALPLLAGLALAKDQASAQGKDQRLEQVYGSQLMTRDERDDLSAKMRAAKTAAEREQIRKEHHARMRARAGARRVSLPDDPPEKGNGMGGGTGVGPGNGGMGLIGGRGRGSGL